MDYTSLDLLADGSKLFVENSSMPQNQKELAKFGVDCLTELIKRFNVPPQVNFSMMGFSLDQIYALKAAAKECNALSVPRQRSACTMLENGGRRYFRILQHNRFTVAGSHEHEGQCK